MAFSRAQIELKNPEFCVDVVEATAMNFSTAALGMPTKKLSRKTAQNLKFTVRLPLIGREYGASAPPKQLTAQESLAQVVFRGLEKRFSGAMFFDPTAIHEDNIVGKTAGLAQIVGRNNCRGVAVSR